MSDFEDDEFDGPIKKFMYVNRKAPYGTVYALEGLEVVLITAAFDQDVSMVFIDDGVFQIKKDQETSAINMKNFSPTYRALEGYEVEKVYAEKESLVARGMDQDDLVIPVEILTASEIAELMDAQDVIVSF
jgi:tRNA 2-thiouridine synthesizing protein C